MRINYYTLYLQNTDILRPRCFFSNKYPKNKQFCTKNTLIKTRHHYLNNLSQPIKDRALMIRIQSNLHFSSNSVHLKSVNIHSTLTTW